MLIRQLQIMDNSNLEKKIDEILTLLISQKQALTFEDLVKYTGLSKSYLYKLTSRGEIPFFKPFGKILYFNREEIDTWLLRNRSKTNEEILNEVTTNRTLKR